MSKRSGVPVALLSGVMVHAGWHAVLATGVGMLICCSGALRAVLLHVGWRAGLATGVVRYSACRCGALWCVVVFGGTNDSQMYFEGGVVETPRGVAGHQGK